MTVAFIDKATVTDFFIGLKSIKFYEPDIQFNFLRILAFMKSDI